MKRITPKNSESTDGKFDNLPQPYRMICKVIDEDILDNAWFEIIRKHPDIQLKSDGTPIELNRNHNLNNKIKCERYKSFGSYITSLVVCGADVICSIDDSGTFHLCNQQTMELLTSRDLHANQEPADLLTYYKVAAVSAQPVAASSSSAAFHVARVLVYALVKATAPAAAPVDAAAAKKAVKGAPVEEVVEQKAASVKLIVLDISRAPGAAASSAIEAGADHIGSSGTHVYSVAIIHNFCVDSYYFTAEELTADALGGVAERLNFDISSDGRALAFLSDGTRGACILYELAAYIAPPVPEQLPRQLPEETTAETQETEMTAAATTTSEIAVTEPLVIASIDAGHASLKGHKMKAVSMFARNNPQVVSTTQVITHSTFKVVAGAGTTRTSGASGTAIAKSGPLSGAATPRAAAAVVATVVPLTAQYWEELALVVILRDVSFVVLHGVSAAPVKAAGAVAAAPAVVDAGAKGGKKGAAAPVIEIPVASLTPYTTYSLCQWNLTSAVSAHALDITRQYLAIGQVDGTTALWNLSGQIFIKTLGVHKSSITCLSLQRNIETGVYYLISGCLDGTMCFFSSSPASSSSLTGTEAIPVSAMELKEFRNDMRFSAVVQLKLPFKIPLLSGGAMQQQTAITNRNTGMLREMSSCLIMAEYADGSIVSYNYESCTLLGQLGTVDRINFKTVSMSLFSDRFLPDIATLRSEAEVAAAVKAQEEEAAKLAAEAAAAEALAKRIANGSEEEQDEPVAAATLTTSTASCGDSTTDEILEVDVTLRNDFLADNGTWGYESYAALVRCVSQEGATMQRFAGCWAVSGTYIYCMFARTGKLCMGFFPVASILGLGLHAMNTLDVLNNSAVTMGVKGMVATTTKRQGSVGGRKLLSMTSSSSLPRPVSPGANTNGGRLASPGANGHRGLTSSMSGLQTNSSGMLSLGTAAAAAGIKGKGTGGDAAAVTGGATITKLKLVVAAPDAVTTQEIFQYKMQRTSVGLSAKKKQSITKQFQSLGDFV